MTEEELKRSIGGVTDVRGLAERFVELALKDFEGRVHPKDLRHTKALLLGQLCEDPYLQNKLARVFSLAGIR